MVSALPSLPATACPRRAMMGAGESGNPSQATGITDPDYPCDCLASDTATRQVANHCHQFLFDHWYVRRKRHSMLNDQTTGKSARKLTELLTLCLEKWGIQSLTDIQELAIAAGVRLGLSARSILETKMD